MTEIRWAAPHDVEDIHTLWELVFGDSPEVQDGLLRAFGGVERVLLLREDGALRSMTTLSPVTLHTQSGDEQAAYLYALATHPGARGRGLGSLLVRRGEELLGLEGVRAVILVPAEGSLFDYYKPLGYCPAFYQNRVSWEPGERPAAATIPQPLEPAEYNALRRRLLACGVYVDYPQPIVDLLGEICALTGGGLLRLDLMDSPGCAAVEGRDGEIWIRELLCRTQDVETALSALATAFPTKRCRCALPSEAGMPGERTPFGVIHRLDGGMIPTGGWLGFPFD